MARGAFPDSHRQHVGMPGMHGAVGGRRPAAQRPVDRPWAPVSTTASPASSTRSPPGQGHPRRYRPGEIGKNRPADVPIVGDRQAVIADLIEALCAELATDGAPPDLTAWWVHLNGLAKPSR